MLIFTTLCTFSLIARKIGVGPPSEGQDRYEVFNGVGKMKSLSCAIQVCNQFSSVSLIFVFCEFLDNLISLDLEHLSK